MGTASRRCFPYQTFRTKTRDVALALGSEKLWSIFCPLVGRPAQRPALQTASGAVREPRSLIATLQEILLTRTYEEWEALLVPAGIAMGAINTIDQVVEHPQVRARGASSTSSTRARAR